MAELAVVGALVGAAGSIMGGFAKKSAADDEAVQQEAAGREEFAASQRDAFAKRKEGVLLNSRAQALAASSGAGAGADAPSIVKLMGDIAGQAEYNTQADLYGGKQRRAGLFQAADNRRKEGQAALVGSIFEGVSKGIGAFG